MNLREIGLEIRPKIKGLVLSVVGMAAIATISCSNNDVGGVSLVNCEKGLELNSVTLFLPSGESIRVGSTLIAATTNPGSITVESSRRVDVFSKIELVPEGSTIVRRIDGKILLTIPENPRSDENNPTERIIIHDGRKTFTVTGKPPDNKEISGAQLTILASCLPEKK